MTAAHFLIGRVLLSAGLLSIRDAGRSTVIVTDASDAIHSPGCAEAGMGLCSLADAITFTNAHPGSDEIHFDIPGSGVRAIPGTLPDVTDPVLIDGYSQPGSSPNTNGPTEADNAVRLIRIEDLIVRADDTTVRGLSADEILLDPIVSEDCCPDVLNGLVTGDFVRLVTLHLATVTIGGSAATSWAGSCSARTARKEAPTPRSGATSSGRMRREPPRFRGRESGSTARTARLWSAAGWRAKAT